LSKIAYGVTAALTVAFVELLHASVLLVFALTSLALDGKSNWLEGAVRRLRFRCPRILPLAVAADRDG
jgi:Ca2+/H+ antiporter